MRIAVVIPAFNEAATIADVVRAVTAAGTVVVVDDASSDGTAAAAAAAGAEVVRNARNLGYDGALQRGFEAADRLAADIAITIDADGQHDAASVGRMLAPLLAGECDLVLGIRPAAARTAEWLFNLYTRVRFGVPDILCGMKAYRMAVYRAHGRFDGSRSIGTELALAALRRGARVQTMPVPVRPRIGAPRFGSTIRANLRILRALWMALASDLADSLRLRHERRPAGQRP